MIKMKVKFKNDRNMDLIGILEGEGERGVVLCSHFTGFKEVRHYHALGSALAENGFVSLRFDYGDCIGESEGSCKTMSLSHQVLDTFSAIDYLIGRGVESIGLFGHSLGGTTALITSANDKRVKAVVVAAALASADYDILFKDKIDEWEKTGVAKFPSWKRSEIEIGIGFLNDLKRYDASQLARSINAPLLILQPELDLMVTSDNAKKIYSSANEPKELMYVMGADHMFGTMETENKMIDETIRWFDKWL